MEYYPFMIKSDISYKYILEIHITHAYIICWRNTCALYNVHGTVSRPFIIFQCSFIFLCNDIPSTYDSGSLFFLSTFEFSVALSGTYASLYNIGSSSRIVPIHRLELTYPVREISTRWRASHASIGFRRVFSTGQLDTRNLVHRQS